MFFVPGAGVSQKAHGREPGFRGLCHGHRSKTQKVRHVRQIYLPHVSRFLWEKGAWLKVGLFERPQLHFAGTEARCMFLPPFCTLLCPKSCFS